MKPDGKKPDRGKEGPTFSQKIWKWLSSNQVEGRPYIWDVLWNAYQIGHHLDEIDRILAEQKQAQRIYRKEIKEINKRKIQFKVIAGLRCRIIP